MPMVTVTIDNQRVEVPEGTPILDAARQLGIAIPTLCHRDDLPPNASCFACVVRLRGRSGMVPSCATVVEPGMIVECDVPEVAEARRTALELLLSDHLGDCLAPCHLTCPATMDIPRMIRHIARDQLQDAIRTVKETIALPAVLGRICPAPCEKACRRRGVDSPVAICLLKRHAADVDLASPAPYQPSCKPPSGRQVAIVGTGPAGLAAACYLLQEGHRCVLFDDHDQPGGMLRYGVPEAALPRPVLDAEIGVIGRMGAEFQLGTRVGEQVPFETLRRDFHAVFVAVGEMSPEKERALGLAMSGRGLATERATLQTPVAGVFAGGDAVHPLRLTVRANADGRSAAVAIHQYLSGQPVTGRSRPFSTHYGRLDAQELAAFAPESGPRDRVTPALPPAGFSREEAAAEASRCLHCDCLKQEDCRLRDWSAKLGADAARHRGTRRRFEKHAEHPDVVYEPGKCIDCGLCIQVAARQGEPVGLTFSGRGFDVRVRAPFRESIAAALKTAGEACAAVCPTGAISMKEGK